MISMKVKGLDELISKTNKANRVLDSEVKKALGQSVAMVEGESKRRTPVDTGLLRSSIGGARGWQWVRGWTASIGTNVGYAKYVHEGNARHTVGERKFMEKGLTASQNFIERAMTKALGKTARSFTKRN